MPPLRPTFIALLLVGTHVIFPSQQLLGKPAATEVDHLLTLICTDADPPCHDLGKLEEVPVQNRWKIREALALLRHFFGDKDKLVRILLNTQVIASNEAPVVQRGNSVIAAKAAVGRHAKTGEPYLFFNSSQFVDLASVVRLVLLGSAMRWHPLFVTRPSPGTRPDGVPRPDEARESDCQVHLATLQEVEPVLSQIRDKLADLDFPTGELRMQFDREIDLNRKERRWYMEHCLAKT